MKRPKIKWCEEEVETILKYYLSLDGITNKERIYKTWNDLYNNNNKFGYFRTFNTFKTFLATEVSKRKIKVFAYKNPPKGFYLIPNTKWHCMNKEMQVLNMKTGKFLNNFKNNKGVIITRISEYDIITKSTSRIYVELFLDPSKPYQIQENGIPIQTDKMKRRGWNYLPKKSYNEWLKKQNKLAQSK